MIKVNAILILFLLVLNFIAFCDNIPPPPKSFVTVHKCCPSNQYLLDYVSDIKCHNVTNQTGPWEPKFEEVQGGSTSYKLVTGIPVCQTTTRWRVDDIEATCDRLVLLKDGKLRHITYHEGMPESCSENEADKQLWDFTQTDYCIDKVNSRYFSYCG